MNSAIVWCIENENLIQKKPLPDETPKEKDENITTKLMKNFTVTKGYSNLIFDKKWKLCIYKDHVSLKKRNKKDLGFSYSLLKLILQQ